MNHDARVMLAWARALVGRRYGHDSDDDDTTDCCQAVEAMLAERYGNKVLEERAALRIYAGQSLWSPVEACVRLGIGEATDHPIPGRWHVVQGWRLNKSGERRGHTFGYYEPAAMSRGSGLVTNANTYGLWIYDATWGEASGRFSIGVKLAALIDRGSL